MFVLWVVVNHRDTLNPLIGESPDPELIAKIGRNRLES